MARVVGKLGKRERNAVEREKIKGQELFQHLLRLMITLISNKLFSLPSIFCIKNSKLK